MMRFEDLNDEALILVGEYLGPDDSRSELIRANRSIHERFPLRFVCDLSVLQKVIGMNPKLISVEIHDSSEAIEVLRFIRPLSPMRRYMFYRQILGKYARAEEIRRYISTYDIAAPVLHSAWVAHDQELFRLIGEMFRPWYPSQLFMYLTDEYSDMFKVACDVFKPTERQIDDVLRFEVPRRGSEGIAVKLKDSYELSRLDLLREKVAAPSLTHLDLINEADKVCKAAGLKHRKEFISAIVDGHARLGTKVETFFLTRNLFRLCEEHAGTIDYFEYLISMGANVQGDLNLDYTLLDCAAQHELYDVCRHLATVHGLHMTSLVFAIHESVSIEFLRFLLDRPGRPDVNSKVILDFENDRYPPYLHVLHRVARVGRIDVLELLIEYGVDLSACVIEGTEREPDYRVTILHCLIERAQNRCVGRRGSINESPVDHRERFVDMARLCLEHEPKLVRMRGRDRKLPIDLITATDDVSIQLRQLIQSFMT